MKKRPTMTLAAATLAVLGTGHATAAGYAVATTVPPDDGGITILDEGSGDERVVLLLTPEAGTSMRDVNTSTTHGTLHASGAESMDETIDTTTTVERSGNVESVAPDGSYTLTSTVDSYEFVVAEGPEELAESFKTDEHLEPLVGLELSLEYDANQTIQSATPAPGTNLTAEQESAIEELVGDSGEELGPFPDVPLGVGARWTAEPAASSSVPYVATFELTSIDSGVANIAITLSGDPAEAFPSFDDVEGTIEGKGTIEMSLDEPIEFAAHLDITLDVDVSDGATDFTFDLVATIDEELTTT